MTDQIQARMTVVLDIQIPGGPKIMLDPNQAKAVREIIEKFEQQMAASAAAANGAGKPNAELPPGDQSQAETLRKSQ